MVLYIETPPRQTLYMGMGTENRQEFKRLNGNLPQKKRHDSTVFSGIASKLTVIKGPVDSRELIGLTAVFSVGAAVG